MTEHKTQMLFKSGRWTRVKRTCSSGFYSIIKRSLTQQSLTYVVGESTLSNNCLFRQFWWMPTVQWRRWPTPHKGRTIRVKTWIQNMTIMINRTTAMQVNPSEDLFCCTKKGNTEKKIAMKQQPRYFHVNVLRSVFTVQCLLSSCTGANQSCSWSVVASALCERYFFSQQPYSIERYVIKHFLDSRRVLGNNNLVCKLIVYWVIVWYVKKLLFV